VSETEKYSLTNDIDGNSWDITIFPKRNLFDVRLKEIFDYRDLLFLFVKRDIITVYKQTILGPVWYFIQPLLMMIIFIIVFSKIAHIPTDDIPAPIFYLAGIILWNYFADCLHQTADVFYQNAPILEKVYFPRLLIPMSKIISAFIKFLIQSILFFIFYFYFLLKGIDINPTLAILWIPYFILLMAVIGFGAGIIISSITTKYRDIKFLISFGVQLLMYVSPVIYPVSILSEKYKFIMFWNPISHLLEGFKYAFLGVGDLTLSGIIYTTFFALLIIVVGVILFNRIEQDFVDTI
jgi:homopolymeric O-antigen transport system permease protein